ncbi:hypothetical protein [Deinococcus altitudinis]|uniref:hypothetical protein n=1 Tax=Deinococcus altitudinis TaxID=468914 RepID=UPI003891EC83
MNIRTLLMAVLLLFLPAAQVATAQAGTSAPTTASTQPVRLLLASLIVGKDAKGQETLTPTSNTTKPRPGDLLAWKATAVNDLTSSVPDLALTIPIPAATVYLEGSAVLRVGAQTLSPVFSFDGQSFAPAPLKRRINVIKNGVSTLQEVTVPPSEYRAVRWILPALAARSQVLAELRTSVR